MMIWNFVSSFSTFFVGVDLLLCTKSLVVVCMHWITFYLSAALTAQPLGQLSPELPHDFFFIQRLVPKEIFAIDEVFLSVGPRRICFLSNDIGFGIQSPQWPNRSLGLRLGNITDKLLLVKPDIERLIGSSLRHWVGEFVLQVYLVTVEHLNFSPPCVFYHCDIVEVRPIEEIHFLFQLAFILSEPIHEVIQINLERLFIFASFSGIQASLESLFAICVDSQKQFGYLA